jgi:hypothetical protein
MARVRTRIRRREFCEWCGERPAKHQIDNKDVFNYKWEENLCDQCFTRNFYKHGDDDDDRQTWNGLGRAGGGSVMNEPDKEENERLYRISHSLAAMVGLAYSLGTSSSQVVITPPGLSLSRHSHQSLGP